MTQSPELVVQQMIQEGMNALQGLVGPTPQAAVDLRSRYLSWHDEVERLFRSLLPDGSSQFAALESPRHRDIVKDLVPADQLWRDVRSERDALVTALKNAAGAGAALQELIGADGLRYQWSRSDRIGGGSFGQVYRGVAADGADVAIKVVPIRSDSTTRWVEDTVLTERELRVLRDMGGDNSNLLPLLNAQLTDNQLILIMPLAEPNLASEILSGPMAEEQVREIVLDIARGLQQLAPSGIIHRDVKPENVLRWNSRWALADFGIARYSHEGTATYTWRLIHKPRRSIVRRWL